MALETGTYINSLVSSNPASTDGLAQADDHLRLLKSTIKATLPNVTGAITSTHTELNALTGVTASPAEINKLDGLTATTAQLNAIAATGGIPSGGIIMWSGAVSAIPAGWVLCNGSNSSPDLRNRFVVGAGSTYAVNATGGTDSVSLSTANLPAHNHSFSGTGTTNTTGAHVHASGWYGPRGASGQAIIFASNDPNDGNVNTGSAGNHSHTVSVSGTTNNTGSGSAHENRPPYYALAYIMKT
jgi:microcystin-dependent protein